MFERYNESARRVVLLSRSFASELGGAAIEPAHILLALLEEDPELFRIWFRREEDLESLRWRIEEQARVMGGGAIETEIHLSPESQQTLALGAEEADCNGALEILPLHLLAGLLNGDTAAAQALRELGADPRQARLLFVASSHARADGTTEAEDLVRLIEQLPRSQLGRARVLLQALVETERAGRQE